MPEIRPEAASIEKAVRTMASGQLEEARAAKRGLWRIVRYAGRPAADLERRAVVEALLAVAREEFPADAVREVLWMLSEIGGDEAVPVIKPLLADKTLGEDARMVLERIPGDASLAALKAALETVPDEFRPPIVQSLRARGVDVPGYPCQKLVPTRATTVKPVE